MLRTPAPSWLALAIAAASLSAQAPAPPSEEGIEDLLALLNTPVTTASKRAERAQDAPSVISVVTRDQFQAHGWTSLNEALYALPGFGPARDYDRRTVASRGLFEGWNNNHILVLVDGIPFNDNLYGTAYTWEITPVHFIKTFEVVRGPGSALYGSNATNSATQIRTISPWDLPGGGEAQIRIGSRGDRIFDVAMGHQGDLFAATMAFTSFRTDGIEQRSYDGSLRDDGAGNLLKFPIQDQRESTFGWLKLEGMGALKGWTVQAIDQRWEFKTGHGWVWQAPDQGESLAESRQIFALAYSGKVGERWSQEYLLRTQRHALTWDIRFYPADGFFGSYPAGVNEYLETSAQDVFGRAQWSVDLPSDANLLFGLEVDRFEYDGDQAHGANIEMATFSPNPGNAMRPLGPWLGYLEDKPVLNTGAYAQFTSGGLLGPKTRLVLGIRSDRFSFDHRRLGTPGAPDGSRSFSQVSPRVALVFKPTPDLALKAMVGKAFRAPSPSELGGANTLTLASNIEALKPESLTTAELAVDWILSPNLNWRTNLYRTKFSDQIAYSAANFNLSTNIYTLTTEGLETELLFGFKSLRGYVNYSFARRVDEEILDASIAPSPDSLTWDPAHRFKFGAIYTRGPLQASAVGYWQSETDRRATDVGTQPIPLLGVDFDVDPYRPRSLDGWFTVDARVSYDLRSWLTVSIYATNLLDTDKNKLVKIQAFPFDYEGEGRKVGTVVRLIF